MKVIIPDELKKDAPQTTFGKILTATPVAMAVLATMLAGLASSEMTKAQYDRSLAAQQQSKAGDQWSFFQAKRLRGAYQRNTADLLQSVTDIAPIEPAAIKSSVESLASQVSGGRAAEAAQLKTELLAWLEAPSSQQMLALLQKGELPTLPAGVSIPANIKAALDAVESLEPDPVIARV